LIEYLIPLADTIEDHLVNWDLLEMVWQPKGDPFLLYQDLLG
jgi:hypothetical protein